MHTVFLNRNDVIAIFQYCMQVVSVTPWLIVSSQILTLSTVAVAQSKTGVRNVWAAHLQLCLSDISHQPPVFLLILKAAIDLPSPGATHNC